MLTVDDATAFLLELGLAEPGWVIDGLLCVSSAARRNRNLRVEGPHGAGYFVKQPDDPAEGGHQTLRAEAEFYAFCHETPAAAAMRRIVPRVTYFDRDSALLVLELVADATSLWAYHQARAVQDFPVDAGRAGPRSGDRS